MEENYSFPITGMYCVNCARGVERAVRALEGVKSAEVNAATQTLYVAMASGKDRVAEVVEAIREVGFDVLLSEFRVHIEGLGNPERAREIRAMLASIEGVLEIEINSAAGEAVLDYIPGQIGPIGIVRAIRDAGFVPALDTAGDAASSLDAEVDARIREYYDQRHKFQVGLIFTIPLVILSFARNTGTPDAWSQGFWMDLLLWVLATPVLFYTGADYFRRGWSSLRDQSSNLDVLVILGTSVAYFYSILVIFFPAAGSHVYFDIAAVVVVLVKLGKLLEVRLRGRTSRLFMKLKDLAPRQVLRLQDGREEKISAPEIAEGDFLVLYPGSYVPADGIVTEGNGTVDESTITGESIPVDKKMGDRVLAGTLNHYGRLVIRAEKIGRETMLARIIRMVREAQGSRPRVQALADEASAIFAPAVIMLAIFASLLWIFITGDFAEATIRFIAVLVIACPAALGLAAPTAVMAATGRAAEHGILFKTGQAIEDAAPIDTVVFNKTGTVTYGRPELTDTIPCNDQFSAKDLLVYAAAAETGFDHPLGKALIDRAKELDFDLPRAEGSVYVSGAGVKSVCNGEPVVLGRPGWMTEQGIGTGQADEEIRRLKEEGKTVLCLAVNGDLKGICAFADVPRPEMPAIISRLKTMGITPVLVTGDNRESAEAVARYCGIEQVFPHVRPDEKVKTVKQFQDAGKRVAAVGDGINDAPALAAADLGITLGPGTDAALESGAVVLTMGKIEQVPVVFALGRASMRIIRKNLFWAFCYNIILIPVAAGILAPLHGVPDMLRHLNPMLGALVMVLGSLNVFWNSLRLYRSRDLVLREEEGRMPPIKPGGDYSRWGKPLEKDAGHPKS